MYLRHSLRQFELPLAALPHSQRLVELLFQGAAKGIRYAMNPDTANSVK
jgi:hypothetical protein